MPAETISTAPTKSDSLVYAVVGKPNCGKTTVFNALTGMRQKVANYPGATVECYLGIARGQHGEKIALLDLPGTYSLAATSPDETLARDVMLGRHSVPPTPSRFVCVADATNLKHCLFLASQTAELGKPVILALNMMDEARAMGIHLDTNLLEQELGVTVVPMEARTGVGVTDLRSALSRESLPPARAMVPLPEPVHQAVAELTPLFDQVLHQGTSLEDQKAAAGHALLWLTDTTGEAGLATLEPEVASRVISAQEKLDQELPGWRSEVIAARQKWVAELAERVTKTGEPVSRQVTRKLDSVLLHPVLGWVALLGIMFGIFYSIFTLASYPMDLIDAGFGALGEWVASLMPEGQLSSLLVDGVIAGVGGVVIFLPQILFLFFFISILEATGYMPRIAFMLDRLFSAFGLDGRAFIPLLSSYACAIPGIMAARTITSPLERMATIMVAPFMSCSARLPVYLLMIAVLVPGSGPWAGLQETLLLAGAYALGTVVALIGALILRKTMLKGEAGGFTIELPPYRLPVWRNVLLTMWDRGMIFVRKAGTIILAISIILWFLLSYPRIEGADGSEQIRQSYAGQVGHAIEPIIQPLGYDWKMGIGILASFAAREVFVSTMAITYSVEEDEENSTPLLEAMQKEVWEDGTPVFTPLTALSLMVFFIFAMQCMSTLAVVKRETNSWFWPLFQLGFMTVVAYVAALVVYQGGQLLGFQ